MVKWYPLMALLIIQIRNLTVTIVEILKENLFIPRLGSFSNSTRAKASLVFLIVGRNTDALV